MRNIPREGLDVEFKIPPTTITQTMSREDDLVKAFRSPIGCQVHLDLDHRDIQVSGKVETSVSLTCARCGDEFDRPVAVDLAFTCSPQSKAVVKGDAYQEAEEGLIFYKNEEVDLSEIIREQILLSLPMVSLCREDCQGLCPTCGVNLNTDEPHQCVRAQRR